MIIFPNYYIVSTLLLLELSFATHVILIAPGIAVLRVKRVLYPHVVHAGQQLGHTVVALTLAVTLLKGKE